MWVIQSIKRSFFFLVNCITMKALHIPGFLKVLKSKSLHIKSPELPEDTCHQFSLHTIKAATNNFHPDSIVGEGRFGSVYRGTINGLMMVAIKRYRSSSYGGFRELQNEVKVLCQLRHPHLVSLIGFCTEKNEIILVYEFTNRGSLCSYLYGNNKRYVSLPWKQRLQICIDAANGLHYLHAGAKSTVIHRHVKTSNLLLDEDWSCKLSDFGLSKLLSCSKSKESIRIELDVSGTYGYIAPEYLESGVMTDKSEVYSFGVVLFEVLLGRRAFDRTLPNNQQHIIEWSSDFIKQGTIYHVIDPYLKGRIAPECFKKYLDIACSCVHCDGNERPAMGEVEVMLELALCWQNKADSEQIAINPLGEPLYEEVFCAFDHNFGLYKTNGSGHSSNSGSCYDDFEYIPEFDSK